VRKEWKCLDGQCEEHITKCKNKKCDSVNNRFKAEEFKPEILEPFNFNFNFAEFFKFPEFSGLMDFMIDTKNIEYFFSNAKFINSKCDGDTCTTKTKTCRNDKCEEQTTTRKLQK
jgi:hypothetical protein